MSVTEPIQARHPLLVCHALAGDLLMTVPTLRALRERWGDSLRLVCGVEPEHRRVFEALGFTQILAVRFEFPDDPKKQDTIPKGSWWFDVSAVPSFAQGCDLYINLTENCSDCFDQLDERLQLPSVGYHESADTRITYPAQEPLHAMDNHFLVAQAVCPEAHLGNHAHFPHRSDAAAVRAMVREQMKGRRMVVLHADTKPDKMWPLDRWAAWLQRLWQAEPETNVVLVGYPALPISSFAVDDRLIDCRDLPLTVSYEIVAMADQFVGIDSCMIHAADLCRVPSVGLFTEVFTPDFFGLRWADGHCLVGANPPTDVSVESMWQAYCRVKERQWS